MALHEVPGVLTAKEQRELLQILNRGIDGLCVFVRRFALRYQLDGTILLYRKRAPLYAVNDGLYGAYSVYPRNYTKDPAARS